jgi:DNA polymerase-3 subunit alpha
MIIFKSQFSLCHGVLSPAEIVEWAAAAGFRQACLAETNSTASAIEFTRQAQARGLEPIIGVDFRNQQERQYLVLARNNQGFTEINRFLSHYLKTKEDFPAEANWSEDCLVVYPWFKKPQRSLASNEYLRVEVWELNRLAGKKGQVPPDKLIALYTNQFRHKRDYNTHRLLRAIGENQLLSKLKAEQQEKPYWGLLNYQGLREAFSRAPEWVDRGQALLRECGINFIFKDYQRSENRRYYTSSAAEDRALIHQLCEDGLRYRYPQASATVRERLQRELAIIEQRGYYSYFLINWDIVSYARRKNYFYVGRGSGANSLVAYLLRITDVDPIELNLYFERFMNQYRQQPPDFDVDFSWRDRQDLTRYIFQRFPKATLLGAHTTFKYRAAVRELGKVLGLPGRDIDALSKNKGQAQSPDEMQQLVLRYGQRIQDFPHQLTIHSSGILIPEKEIYHFGATWLPPKGFATSQFDMYSAEDVGLYKFDILGQRGLAKIKESLKIIKQNQPQAQLPDIHEVKAFYQDEKIKNLLRQGKTMACFYVESPAMRGLLTKLRADTYLGLVAASSIIRPGVSQSGMMAEYIKRYREPERRQYIHPKIGEILEETYGVMVYQEDVLKVAHYFAGLSLEEADVLRRGMSWKFRERNEFHTIKDKFFTNCQKKGYPPAISKEVWRQIESFGNYAFAKGHSASYAVESYQSLFLKAYFPLEYMVATVNNGGGFYSVETYLNEARLHGAEVVAPDINISNWETTIRGKTIYLGFQHLKDLEISLGEALLEERASNGPYKSLRDLTDRVAISLEQLLITIRINAWRGIEEDKKKLLWEAHFLLGDCKRSQPVADLFRTGDQKFELPALEKSPYEQAVDEIELLGFPLSSPFQLVPELPQNFISAKEMSCHLGQKVQMCGYLIHVKNLTTRSKKAAHMMFGTFLDQAGDFIDTVHFPESAARHRFQGKGIYRLEGRLIEEYDFISLEVSAMERLPYVNFLD